MITYFQAASRLLARPSKPTSAALASVLPSTRTNSSPRLPGLERGQHQRREQAEEREVQLHLEGAELAAVFLRGDVGDGAERGQQRHAGDGQQEEPAERVGVQEAVPALQRTGAGQRRQQRDRAAERDGGADRLGHGRCPGAGRRPARRPGRPAGPAR